jgi:hypothetical protein
MSFHRTLFNTMESDTTYKTMTSAKEEVGIIRGESRESINSEAVDGD